MQLNAAPLPTAVSSSTESRLWFKTYDAVFLLVALAIVLFYVFGAQPGFPLDDSWIHQTYARNLGERGEWAFIPGEPSAASTSFLYTPLLALGYALGVPFLVWTHALGWLALALTAMIGARLAERLVPGRSFVPLLTGLALVLAWHLTWAAVSGMETMIFGMWTLALIWLAWRERDEPPLAPVVRGAVFGAAAALATLTRPEGIILAGLCGLALLLVWRSWRVALLWIVGAAVGFAALMTPYLIHNYTLTGGLLPDTAAAKWTQNSPLLLQPYPVRVLNLLYPLAAGMQVMLIPAAIWYVVRVVRHIRQDRAALLYLLPLLWAAALIAVYAARLPAPYQHGRYVIPALPAFITVGVIGMVWLLRDWRGTLIGRSVGRAMALTTIVLCVLFAVSIGRDAFIKDVQIIQEEMVTAARWIADNIPPDELMAVHDIGAVGYFAPRPMVDIAGLITPELVPFMLDREALYQYLFERGVRYAVGSPDQMPGGDDFDARLCPIYETGGVTARAAGAENVHVYRLAWGGDCP